jgi:F-type H+-transporting ATPase subunit b
MFLITLFSQFSPGEGFGFNGNILETNLINLSVVIGVVVSFGGDALRSLLENRKQTIVINLQEADQRAKEAQEKLNQVRNQLELAKKKSAEIRKQGSITADIEKKQCIRQTQEDALRLKEVKQETLQFQQQKAINQVSQKVISLALSQVYEKLHNRLDASFHSSVNNFNIVLFTNYKKK